MKPSLIRLTTVAVLALFISACSSTTFFYNRLDFLIPWYLDRYVDLDREQDRFLDRQLAPFLAWHREEELPRYLTLLEETEQALDEPVTAQMIEDLSLSVEAAYERVEVRGLEWMISLGEQLSDEQLAEFIDELRERRSLGVQHPLVVADLRVPVDVGLGIPLPTFPFLVEIAELFDL